MKTVVRQIGALVRLSFLELWRRNDVFGLLILSLAVMAPLAMATPFGAAGASRYMDEAALLLIWGFSLFISLGTGGGSFRPSSPRGRFIRFSRSRFPAHGFCSASILGRLRRRPRR